MRIDRNKKKKANTYIPPFGDCFKSLPLIQIFVNTSDYRFFYRYNVEIKDVLKIQALKTYLVEIT